MGLFGIFSGKSPEVHEQRGDELARTGAFGEARIAYEKALHKIEKRFPEKTPLAARLNEKIRGVNESLARAHVENADNLAAVGDLEEARDLYALAAELTRDPAFREVIGKKAAFAFSDRPPAPKTDPDPEDDMPGAEALPEILPEDFADVDDDELFSILCHTHPTGTEDEYRGYGEAFVRGYIALNRGEFKTAERELSQALAENPGGNRIPLELATACIHVRQYDRARGLLEAFLADHPEEVRAYQLLCELFWEIRDYDSTNRLLAGAPDALGTDLSILLLKGETRFQEQAFDEAEAVFRKAMAIHGRDEIVSRALAKTLEAKGEIDSAREMYAEMINRCTSCRRAVDPFLKRRYAELCFKAGDHSSRLLDIYLGLTQEDPENQSLYYRRIASIHEERGETREARRFAAFAENAS